MILTQAAQSFLEANKDRRIVFTNGCFDILHVGHVTYLKQAQAEGDLLFLGLNSDQSIKRLKGKERPINQELDRKLVLESLRCVDFVEIFEEDTPLTLIKAVRPSFLVKGGDWAVESIVGYDVVSSYGGIVKSLDFIAGYSTTSTIEKMRT